MTASQKKGKSLLFKVVVVGACCLFLMFATVVGGVVYAGYKIKQKVGETAQQYGVDLDSMAAASRAAKSAPAVKRVDPCSLLPKEEAETIIGERIARMESRGGRECHYFSEPASPEETRARMKKGLAQMDRKVKGQDIEGLEQVTKTMLSGATGGASYFAVTVDWEDDGASLLGMKLLGGMGAGDAGGSQSLPGIGDQAALGPMACMLMFTKGRAGVQIDLRMLPDGREKGIAIAKAVAARL